VIGKISDPRGERVSGRIYYLFGPGRREEHTDPHLIAGWRHPAELEPLLLPDGHRDFRHLNGLLQQPHAALGPRGFERPVWHCAVRAAPEDKVLSDDEWAQIAGDIMHRTRLAPRGQDDDAVRWVAVRHGEDHIHVVAMLARQDGGKPRLSNERYRVRETCRAAEERYGLRRTAPGDRTAAPRPTRAEHEKTRRRSWDEAPRVTLKRAVSTAAAGAAAPGRAARLIIADTTVWPGVPVAAWPPAQPDKGTSPAIGYAPPRGRGIQAIPADIPLACWLPIQPGLTAHGLRHSHKTWMAEDGIPEILAEQRLGHQVPGMRGLYAHASHRMRDDLTAALQTRWAESLSDRAAIHPHSPVPLLDELLAPLRGETMGSAKPTTPRRAPQQPPTPGDSEKLISQIPPNHPKGPTLPTRVEPALRASDLARYQESGSGAKGTRTPDPLLAKIVDLAA
jgi:hypothetical protein